MQNKLPEDFGVHDEQAGWELGGWLQLQTPVAHDTLTLTIRLQSTLYKRIRTERRCRHGLCVIRRRCCPLLYGSKPRSFIGRPLDEAKQGTSWEWIMARFIGGCRRSTCILIYIGATNQYGPRRSNSIHHLQLATKGSTLHYLALTATLKRSMRITICFWCLNDHLILLLGVNTF